MAMARNMSGSFNPGVRWGEGAGSVGGYPALLLMVGLSPPRALFRSLGVEDPYPQQLEAGSAEHLPLDDFQPIDLPFHPLGLPVSRAPSPVAWRSLPRSHALPRRASAARQRHRWT